MVFLLLAVSLAALFAQPRDAQIQAHLHAAAEANARQDWKTAAQEYEGAIALDPGNAEAHARLGMAYQNAGNLPKAVGSLERAIQLDPALPRVGTLLALSYLGVGKPREAIPYLEKAFAIEDQPAMRSLVGQRLVESYFATGEEEKGLEAVQKLRKLAPDDPDVLYTASKAYANLWNGAVQRMLAKAGNSYRVHEVFAEALEAQEKYSDAAKEYRQIIQMDPQLPGIHYRLGRMILRNAPPTEADPLALVEFQKELEINPLDVPTHTEIAEIRLRARQLGEAMRYFSRASELQPGYAPARLGLGKVLLAQKQPQKGLEQLEIAMKLAPEDESIHYNLMIAYRTVGRTADAKREFDIFQTLRAEKQQSRSSMLNYLKGSPTPAPGRQPSSKEP